MKRGFLLLALLACFAASLVSTKPSGAASQSTNNERRIALVIGNNTYKTGPLLNPVNDATDMAVALHALGFQVTLKTNLSHRGMVQAIQQFGDELRAGDVGLFFYSGHGTQVNGENYLVPVDANIHREEELEYECVNAGRVIAQMRAARNRMNIVILDACRDNPFVQSGRGNTKGLAVMNAAGGMLIAYSTAPGSTANDGSGRNSPYTAALLKYLSQKSLRVEDVFKRTRADVMRGSEYKQIPWESSSLVEDYCLSGDCGGLIVGNSTREKEGSDNRNAGKPEAPAKSEPTNANTVNANSPPLMTNPSPANPPRQENVDVQSYTETVNRVGIEMVRVPAGKFLMGSWAGEGYVIEHPQHEVTIAKSFYMGKYEVTQAQWRAVATKLPKVKIDLNPDPSRFNGDNVPVERVSWEEATEFCARLTRATGKTYRLPTEAEWEYACRAGTTGKWAGRLDEMGWYASNSGKSTIDAEDIARTDAKNYSAFLTKNGCKTHEVGTRLPNNFGLYDMHGNVWEWCEDVFHYDYNGAPTDGSAWLTPRSDGKDYRLLRGGSWYNSSMSCRSAFRLRYAADTRLIYHGFRLVAVV